MLSCSLDLWNDATNAIVHSIDKALERAGLIIQGQKAQYRPCTIDVTPLKEISKWTEQYRHIWEARFDRIDDYINQLNYKENHNE